MSYHPYRLTSAPWGRVPQNAPLTRNDLLLVEPVSSHLGESSLIWTCAESHTATTAFSSALPVRAKS